ncbi:serine/threonine-protein kinase [Streptomyces winkii]|uniref:serine/threonine-protein kinase n=1 Tax=Streptomyces winkii TaxID=3051178 RepID=UPI0028D5F09B|nr:serine/threonine-protein kinase [Streptomyces sp. DSM 40971]
MSSVFLSHTRGGQPVALKVIRQEFAQNPEFLRRFTREVEAARRVQGAYTAAVLDSSIEGPQPWLASSYVAGPSLAHAVREHGPLPLETVLPLVAGVAEALQSVHAVDVVHRDLKPSNVLLAADGPRVIDFGIARATDATALTGSNVLLGTPAYMAPEQAEGRSAGPALDVFTLGLVAHFAATGEHPFGEGEGHVLLYRIVAQEPDLAACPEPLRPLLVRCLAKDPDERPTPSDVIDECHRIAAAEGTTLARRQGWWLPAGVAEEMPQHAVTHLASGDAPYADAAAPDAPRAGAGTTANPPLPHVPTAPATQEPSSTRTVRLLGRDRGKTEGSVPFAQTLSRGPHRRAKVTGAVAVALAVVAGGTLATVNWQGDGDQPSNSPGWAMQKTDVPLTIPAPPFGDRSDATWFPSGQCVNADKRLFKSSVFVDLNKLKVDANQKDAADKDLPGRYALQYSNCSNGLGKSGWGPKSGFRIINGHGSWGVVSKRGISAAECKRAATDEKREPRITVQQIQRREVLRSGMGLCVLTGNQTLALLWFTEDEVRPARDGLRDFTVRATQWQPT